MHALKEHALHLAGKEALLRLHYIYVLGAEHYVHRLIRGKSSVHTLKVRIIELHQTVFYHMSGDDIALSHEVCHITVHGLIVDVLGRTYLLDLSVLHDHDLIGHGQGLFLVMGHIDESNAYLLLYALKLILHLLAELQVQCPQRLIQKKHLGLIDQGPGYGHSLLLASGKQGHILLLKALQAYELQHLHDLLLYHVPAHLLDLEAEGDIFINIHMGEEGILLEHGIKLPLIGRHIAYVLPVKIHLALDGLQEASEDTEQGGLAAARWPQQGHKFIFINIKVNIFENGLSVKLHDKAAKLYQSFFFHSSPPYQNMGGVVIQRILASPLPVFKR